MSPPAGNPDMYGRRPTSTSRGKTHARIMDLQHDPAVLPGADHLLRDAPDGSIAAGVRAFHQGWVISKPVTSRRSYERSLAIFLRFLEEEGPAPARPLSELTTERAASHLGWRVRAGLTDEGELRRCAVHLGRLTEWLEGAGYPVQAFDRAALKTAAGFAIEAVPPAFHVATTSAQLRDTSNDDTALSDT